MTEEDRYLKEGAFSRAGSEKYELMVGSIIDLRAADGQFPSERFTVKSISSDIGNPVITLVDDLGKTHTLAGRKSFSIGRNEDCEIRIDNDSVSRIHARINYDPVSHAYILEGHNKNYGKAYNVLKTTMEQKHGVLAHSETIADFRPGEEIEPALIDVALRPGMRVQFVAHDPKYPSLPYYEVKKAIGGSKPQLELERVGDDKDYPQTFKLEGRDASGLLGRAGTAFNVNHPCIGRVHASIGWNDKDKQWEYTTTRKAPVVALGSRFIAEMQQLADHASVKSTAQALGEVKRIDALVGDMQKVRVDMENVQKLELATVLTPYAQRDRGAHSEDSQRGYKNWIEAFSILYQDGLSARHRQELEYGKAAVERIGEYRAELRDMESYGEKLKPVSPKNGMPSAAALLDASRKTNYAADMDKLVKQMCQPLLAPKAGEEAAIYPISGFRGHHTVTRITKDDKGYIVTTYNAGAGAKEVAGGEELVVVKESRRLKKGVKLEDYVRLVAERKMQPMVEYVGVALEAAAQDMLGEVIATRIDKPQGKGNCTTRSTREMLKDVMSEELFSKVHEHVSNPQVCDPAEIMAALQIRRHAMEQYLAEHQVGAPARPRDQADWSQSISIGPGGLEASRGSRKQPIDPASIAAQPRSGFTLKP